MKNPFREQYGVTSVFGNRMLNGKQTYHAGIDLVCDNPLIVSTDDGLVVSSTIITDRNNLTWEWGNYVSILTDDGTRLFYCHMKSRAVRTGQRVHKGDLLGVMGNTGYSFGAHLHFEVRKDGKTINAAEYLGILNKVGKAEEKPMTRDEILAALGDKFCKTIDDIPEEWAKPIVRDLLNIGIINGGTTFEENPDDINMLWSQIKTIIICARMR